MSPTAKIPTCYPSVKAPKCLGDNQQFHSTFAVGREMAKDIFVKQFCPEAATGHAEQTGELFTRMYNPDTKEDIRADITWSVDKRTAAWGPSKEDCGKYM